jgi:hypothetical protein
MVTQAEPIRKSEGNTRAVHLQEIERLANEADSGQAVAELVADALEHLDGAETARSALYGLARHLGKLSHDIDIAGSRIMNDLAPVAS